MTEQLTKEQKELILKSNGWSQLWHPDNWIKDEWIKRQGSIDWAGVSLDQAFEQCMQDIKNNEIREQSKKLYEEHVKNVYKTPE